MALMRSPGHDARELWLASVPRATPATSTGLRCNFHATSRPRRSQVRVEGGFPGLRRTRPPGCILLSTGCVTVVLLLERTLRGAVAAHVGGAEARSHASMEGTGGVLRVRTPRDLAALGSPLSARTDVSFGLGAHQSRRGKTAPVGASRGSGKPGAGGSQGDGAETSILAGAKTARAGPSRPEYPRVRMRLPSSRRAQQRRPGASRSGTAPGRSRAGTENTRRFIREEASDISGALRYSWSKGKGKRPGPSTMLQRNASGPRRPATTGGRARGDGDWPAPAQHPTWVHWHSSQGPEPTRAETPSWAQHDRPETAPAQRHPNDGEVPSSSSPKERVPPPSALKGESPSPRRRKGSDPHVQRRLSRELAPTEADTTRDDSRDDGAVLPDTTQLLEQVASAGEQEVPQAQVTSETARSVADSKSRPVDPEAWLEGTLSSTTRARLLVYGDGSGDADGVVTSLGAGPERDDIGNVATAEAAEAARAAERSGEEPVYDLDLAEALHELAEEQERERQVTDRASKKSPLLAGGGSPTPLDSERGELGPALLPDGEDGRAAAAAHASEACRRAGVDAPGTKHLGHPSGPFVPSEYLQTHSTAATRGQSQPLVTGRVNSTASVVSSVASDGRVSPLRVPEQTEGADEPFTLKQGLHSGLRSLYMDRATLKSTHGLSDDAVDRLYRALFVYSAGFQEVLVSIIGHRRPKLAANVWAAYTCLLENYGDDNVYDSTLGALLRRSRQRDATLRKMFTEHIKGLRREKRAVRREANALGNQLLETQKLLSDEKGTSASLRREIAAAEKREEALRRELKEVTEKQEMTEERLRMSEERRVQAVKDAKLAQTDADELRLQAAAITREGRAVKERLDISQAMRAKLEEIVTQHTADKEAAWREVRAAQERATRARIAMENAQAELLEVQTTAARAAHAEAMMQQHARELVERQADNDELRVQVKAAALRERTLESAVDRLSAEAEALRQENARLKATAAEDASVSAHSFDEATDAAGVDAARPGSAGHARSAVSFMARRATENSIRSSFKSDAPSSDGETEHPDPRDARRSEATEDELLGMLHVADLEAMLDVREPDETTVAVVGAVCVLLDEVPSWKNARDVMVVQKFFIGKLKRLVAGAARASTVEAAKALVAASSEHLSKEAIDATGRKATIVLGNWLLRLAGSHLPSKDTAEIEGIDVKSTVQ